MTLHRWDEIAPEQMNPLVTRQAIHADTLTIARIVLKKGALVPTHQHVNEQVSMIESGALRFHVGDREVTVRAGENLQIPSNVPHSAEAIEDTVAVDVFSPIREDWLRGDDAYLRGR
jgi:quercetin dioxygenase-like cupin family protein